MRRPPRYFWLTLAGLALAGLAPSSARASCGHYVQIRTPSAEGQPAKAAPGPGQTPGATEHEVPAPDAPAPRPCSGPTCSEGRLPVAPPPTAPAPSGEDRWGQGLSQALS